jgi:hypothetical protein
MIVVTPVVTPPSLPDVQTSAVQLSATEADAYALLINVLDPDAFTNGITAAPTDSLGDLAVSLDQVIDLGGTPYITGADTLATDLLPLLDITSLFSGLTTGIDSLLTDLANLPDLSTILTDLGNLPTATDIADDVISALTGPSGVLTTIESDITNVPSLLLGDLTGPGDPLTLIDTDLSSLLTTDTTITGDLGTISGELMTISGELTTITGDLASLI